MLLHKNKIIILLLVTAAYFSLASVSEFLFEPTHTFFTIRLAPAFGLIAALVYGLPALVGIFLGEFLYFYFLHHAEITIPVSIVLAAIAVLYAFTGIRLIQRYLELPNSLTNSSDCFKFFMLAGAGASLVPSLLAVYCISLTEPAVQQSFWLLGTHWWVGQMLGVFIISPITLCFVWKSTSVWQTRIPLIPVLMTALLAVTVITYTYVTFHEKEKLKSVLEQKSLAMSSAIKIKMSNYEEALQSIKSLFEYTPDISPQEFEIFSNKIKARQPEIHATSYQPLVKAHERDAYENRMREFYSNDFQITERDGSGSFKRASEREQYTPVTMRSIYDKNARIIGFDSSSSVKSKSARLQTKATHKVAISRVFKLASTADNSKSIILYLSLKKDDLFSGYVATSVYAIKAIQAAIDSINMDRYAMKVWDGAASENNLIYSKNTLNPEINPELSHIGKITFISHDWEYALIPDSIYLIPLITSQLLTLIFCVLLSSIVSLRLLEFTGKKHELSRRVLEGEAKIQKEIGERERTELERDLLFNNSIDMLCIAGFDGYFKQLNAAFNSTLGWSIDELLSKPWLSFIHPDDQEATIDAGDQLRDGKQLVQFENRYQCKDGAYRWISWNVFPMMEKQQIFCVARDVTERKQTDEALRESEQYNRMLFQESNIGLHLCRMNGQMVDVNPAYARIIGRTVEETLQLSYWDVTPKKYAEQEQLQLEGLEKTGKYGPYEKEYIHADGHLVPVRLSGHILEKDGEKFIWSGAEDITEQKHAEDELKNYREHLEELVEERTQELATQKSIIEKTMNNIEQGVVMYDEDLKLLAINNKYSDIIGISNDIIRHTPNYLELIDYFYNVKLKKPERIDEIIEQAKSKKPHSYLACLPDGKIVEIQHFPIEEGGAVRTFTDVTDRKQAEQEMHNAKETAEKANQAKSNFLTNMSHELRTPLNAVLGFSELMARDPQTNQKQYETLNVINRSGKHLLGLINDVLDMSKIEAGHIKLEPEPVDLHLLLNNLSEMFTQRAKTKALQFSQELTDSLPQYVLLDTGKLKQVLINLLGNAINFTHAGTIILRADAKKIDAGQWRLNFEVEDTGTGIPADELETIFKPFVQSRQSPNKHQGTGLGLAISRQFIDLMSGVLTVQSTVAKGSVFRFEIPAETTNASEIKTEATIIKQQVIGLAADEPERRILIVEDVADNRLLLRSLLETVGFKVREAVNGKEAIEQFEDWQPHLIWMDMRMPVMDGYEATRSIRALPGSKEVKILALTASVFKEQETNILDAGCDAVLHKPFDESELFNAMADHLGLQYVYEETSEPLSKQNVSKPVVEDLQGLPNEWLNELLTAARTGDTKEMLSLTNALDAEYAETKAKLEQCIHQFQLQHLVKILEKNNRGYGKKDD